VTRPLIALPGRRSASVGVLRYSGTVAAEALCEAVWAAGGEPLILHGPDGAPAAGLACRLSRFDGLLMPGGGDLDPARYGQAPEPETDVAPAHDDSLDFAVAAGASEAGLPVLAICRGMQVLNVARGGTLHQHLDTTPSHLNVIHAVEVAPGSRLRAVTGRDRLEVSSYHHQGVARVGAGLRITATADGGGIEALETGEILAVQWHPEDLASASAADAALFADLVERAAKRAVSSGSPHPKSP
jgi:putative glutamine amidotransferase